MRLLLRIVNLSKGKQLNIRLVEKISPDKHSSLFCQTVSSEEKMF